MSIQLYGVYANDPWVTKTKKTPPRTPTPFYATRLTIRQAAQPVLRYSAMQPTPYKASLLLFLNNNTPRVLLLAVHDIGHPLLDLGRVLADISLSHWDVNIDIAVADLGNGADEELGAVSILLTKPRFFQKKKKKKKKKKKLTAVPAAKASTIRPSL